MIDLILKTPVSYTHLDVYKRQVHTVLKNINLDIRKGESVCLIGTNGSGKSTLLKLMTKIIYPNEGTIETNGKLTSLLELGAGFHPDFTGRENIYFNAAVFGLTRKEIEKRVDVYKRQVDILLSVYDPNIDYLIKQLKSLNNQTYDNLKPVSYTHLDVYKRQN